MATVATLTNNKSILEVNHLSVDYKSPFGRVHALRDISLSVSEGEILAIVGESGSGKSTLALAISRLLPVNSAVSGEGRILFRGKDLMYAKRSEVDKIRGTEIFMIFQNPFMSLNPLMKIKEQIKEAISVRDKRRKKITSNFDRGENTTNSAEAEVISVLKSVRIDDAEDVMKRYPHQLSGGQNQRVMLAMAVAERPRLLIADEPTTALDVTTQVQVLSLLKEIIKVTGMSVVFITHDLAVAGSISDRIAVLYGGMVQEVGLTRQLLSNPKHPYTEGLIKSIPSKTKNEGPLEAISGVFSIAGAENMCAFAPRCPLVHVECQRKVPDLITLNVNNESHRLVRCVNYY